MKFYTIAMITFLVALSISIVDTLDVFNWQIANQQELLDESLDRNILNRSYNPTNLVDQGDDQNLFGNFRLGLFDLIKVFSTNVFAFGNIITRFGAPASIAYLITGIVNLIYLVGLLQFFAKEGFKDKR